MSKFISLFLLTLMLVGTLINSAEAARFGGGRSFGAQRSISSFSAAPRAAAMAGPRQNAGANRFLGPLAGLAMGGLLAYLFMGHGLGASMLTWLVLFALGVMVWNFFRNRVQAFAPNAARAHQNNSYSQAQEQSRSRTYEGEFSKTVLPSDFNAASFLRDAKVQFMRLQAAYDAKDLEDIRRFTSPEVFAEIQLQLQERGSKENHTEVVSLEAELLETSSVEQGTESSVKFSGMIKEDLGEPAAHFEEFWHFRKMQGQATWMVIGVQQEG